LILSTFIPILSEIYPLIFANNFSSVNLTSKPISPISREKESAVFGVTVACEKPIFSLFVSFSFLICSIIFLAKELLILSSGKRLTLEYLQK